MGAAAGPAPGGLPRMVSEHRLVHAGDVIHFFTWAFVVMERDWLARRCSGQPRPCLYHRRAAKGGGPWRHRLQCFFNASEKTDSAGTSPQRTSRIRKSIPLVDRVARIGAQMLSLPPFFCPRRNLNGARVLLWTHEHACLSLFRPFEDNGTQVGHKGQRIMDQSRFVVPVTQVRRMSVGEGSIYPETHRASTCQGSVGFPCCSCLASGGYSSLSTRRLRSKMETFWSWDAWVTGHGHTHTATHMYTLTTDPRNCHCIGHPKTCWARVDRCHKIFWQVLVPCVPQLSTLRRIIRHKSSVKNFKSSANPA